MHEMAVSVARDPGLEEALALYRVHVGGVAKSAGVYFDHGCPVPTQLTEVFDRLMWNGLLVVAEGDPVWDLRRISLTEAGQLRQQQRIEIAAPAPEFGATSADTQPPTDHRSSDTRPYTPSGRPDSAQ